MKNCLLPVAILIILLAVMPLSGARPLTPKPLRTDPNLAALIAVRGQFTSLIVDEQRPLTLRVWAADFSPNEQVDFNQLLSRAFSELELPEEPGWGLLAPLDDFIRLHVRLTDRKGRLGWIEVRNAQTWQRVSSIWANSTRMEVAGVVSVPEELREVVVVVYSDVGRVLARIAVDIGKFDAVVPVLIQGSFVPYYLEPEYCPHFGEHPDDTYGIASGNPYVLPGARTGVGSRVGGSGTTVYCDFRNDNSGVGVELPPLMFWNLYRKKTILNTVVFGWFRVADPQAMARLVEAVNTAEVEELSSPLSPVQMLPYSEGCARWRVRFTGQALAVLAIPYERNGRRATLGEFLHAVYTLAPQQGFLSAIVAKAANEWLRDPQNQRASGLKPGEVIAWGDVYSVITDAEKDVPRVVNLTQECRVRVVMMNSNRQEEPAVGTVSAEPVQPIPGLPQSPPRGPSYYQVFVPREGVTLRLGKGWTYRLLLDGVEQIQVSIPAVDDPLTVTLGRSSPVGAPPPR